jgi:hypothetical protein
MAHEDIFGLLRVDIDTTGNDGVVPTIQSGAAALPEFVPVRGGLHTADWWGLVVAELACQAPELRVLAVDLLGRRGKPTNLRTGRIAGWIDSVVTDVMRCSICTFTPPRVR